MKTLTDLMDYAYNTGKKIIEFQRFISPAWVLVDQNGDVKINLTPYRNSHEKLGIAIAMRKICQDENIAMLAHIAEASMRAGKTAEEARASPPIDALAIIGEQRGDPNGVLWTATIKPVGNMRLVDPPDKGGIATGDFTYIINARPAVS